MNDHSTSGSEQIVAWEMEVKGPTSRKWYKHLLYASDVPENPEEAWRDDHEIRNVRPLTYVNNDLSSTDSDQS